MALPRLLWACNLHSRSRPYLAHLQSQESHPSSLWDAVFIKGWRTGDIYHWIVNQKMGPTVNLSALNLLCLNSCSILSFLEELATVILCLCCFPSHKVSIVTLYEVSSFWAGRHQQTIWLDIRNDKDYRTFPCASCTISPLKQYFWTIYKIAILTAEI